VRTLRSTADDEFKSEVRLSLERAFAEGHSIDNAAVELKTLRMASNVPIARVREAVISSIVDRIPLVEGNPAAQRKKISEFVERWGELINRIGGVEQVDAISALQVCSPYHHIEIMYLKYCQNHCARTDRTPLFGQILAAFYQEDVVEESHIRQWHALPASKGADLKPGAILENIRKCWAVGGVLIKQFDEQDSDEEESE
jgi:translation initiation factor eIF-2B subunit epsilon